jgi:hypothetical protein
MRLQLSLNTPGPAGLVEVEVQAKRLELEAVQPREQAKMPASVNTQAIGSGAFGKVYASAGESTWVTAQESGW